MVIKDVISALQDKLGYSQAEAERKVFNGGLKIVSTIDTDIQNILEETFNKTELFLNRHKMKQVICSQKQL